MISSAFRSRQRFLAIATASALIVGGGAFSAPFASADDIEIVKHDIETKGLELSRKHEELKNLEGVLEERSSRVAQLDSLSADAAAKAAQAADARQALQQTVDRIAQAKQTGTSIDDASAVLASGSPQEMIDRQAFLNSLSRGATDEIQRLQDEVKTSARSASKANAKLQEAIFHKTDLEFQRGKLQEQRDALESEIAELEARVNALSDEERTALGGGGSVDLAAA